MAIPYNTTVTGTSIRDALDGHLRVKHSGSWQHVEDVNVKDGGSWRDVKEVWIKQGGSWRLVHEGENFLFNVQINVLVPVDELTLPAKVVALTVPPK